MAEAVGLAFGGIALAGLVTTCVDILEYTSNARYWLCDLSLALTKVALLRYRLHHLGDLYLIATSADHDYSSDDLRALRHGSHCDTATQGLSGVKTVLEQTNRLCRRYSVGHVDEGEHHPGAHRSHKLQPPSLHDAQGKQSPLAALKPWRRLSRQLCWALQDKKKFDKLILDLDFLLSNTEQLFKQAAPCASPTCAQSNLKETSRSPPPVPCNQIYESNPSLIDESPSVSTITCTPATEKTMNSKTKRSSKKTGDTRKRAVEALVHAAESNDSLVLYNAPSSSTHKSGNTESQATMEQPGYKYTDVTATKGSGISIQAKDDSGRQGPVVLDKVILDDLSHISVGGRHALTERRKMMKLEFDLKMAQIQLERDKMKARKDRGRDKKVDKRSDGEGSDSG